MGVRAKRKEAIEGSEREEKGIQRKKVRRKRKEVRGGIEREEKGSQRRE
jgi:hypothetical protein